ncbi:hypothetical protein GGI15_002015 [Coemansia interrupta]|uniref:Fe2OG dioxygenase domain-containing protein n=1 Tax=Coemansia interrupta TaxID=1126814 RepID=A0A9W8HHJ3_9FUNG|nr:hypothetical protein GGI15_002015 [Coemansia interrupta]
MEESDDGQYDYLFDDDDDDDYDKDVGSDSGPQPQADHLLMQLTDLLASTPHPPPPRTTPPTTIPGFHLYRTHLPPTLLASYTTWLTARYFSSPTSNQAMHFGPLLDPTTPLGYLARLCRPLRHNPLAFDQAIVNMYAAGEGIGDHVDLRRFMDGICGVSFGAPAVMRLARVMGGGGGGWQERYAEEVEGEDAVYVEVRPGDVYVLEGEARWKWTHGFPRQIEGRDNVVGRRISVTLRTLVPDE